jgi:hypothetical protein
MPRLTGSTNDTKEVGDVSTKAFPRISSLEGRQVNVALRDGSRIDDCQLVSAGRRGAQTVWLFMNGMDVFLPVAAIADCWEAVPARRIA